jgi:hypothetical protein
MRFRLGYLYRIEGHMLIDHLVYAAPDLTTAVADLEDRFGVRAQAGGRHIGLGTRNAPLALGARLPCWTGRCPPAGPPRRPPLRQPPPYPPPPLRPPDAQRRFGQPAGSAGTWLSAMPKWSR